MIWWQSYGWMRFNINANSIMASLSVGRMTNLYYESFKKLRDGFKRNYEKPFSENSNKISLRLKVEEEVPNQLQAGQ